MTKGEVIQDERPERRSFRRERLERLQLRDDVAERDVAHQAEWHQPPWSRPWGSSPRSRPR